MSKKLSDKELLQKAIGKHIKALREKQNIPQQALASLCDFEKSNLSRLEAGNTNPTIYTLKKIADNLNISLKELMDFDV